MEQNTVETQMDEHLMVIQRDAKSALDRFEKSGLKVDKKFLNYFLKQSIDRLTQTCERYGIEAKYKMSCTATSAMTPALVAENTTIPFLEAEGTGESMEKGENPMKRKAEDTMNAEAEQLKKQKTMGTTVNNDLNGDIWPVSSQLLKSITFFCVHCLDDKNPTKAISGTIDDISGHWLTKHLDESIQKPFKFYAVALVGCFHCKEVGTYHDLVKHHQGKHTNREFVIVDQSNSRKCGICHFKDDDLAEHFKTQHDLNSIPKIFNPIQYSEERIAALLTINVSKKYQCNECNQLFETQDEIGVHFKNAHNGQVVQSKEFVDHRNKPDYLICGYCHKKVDGNRFVAHQSEHTFNFRCTLCSCQSDDLSEIAFHEKMVHGIDSLNYHCSIFPVWMKKKLLNTNMVFNNGLVLKAYNVLETKFDNSKLLDMFIQGFLDVKKDRAKQMIKMHEKRVNLNGSSSAENWNQVPNGTYWNDVQNATTWNGISNGGDAKKDTNHLIGTTPISLALSPFGAAPNIFNEDINRFQKLFEELMQKTQNDQAMNAFELNRTVNDASDQLNRSALQSATVSSNEASLLRELIDQRKLAKNVYVQGICHNFGGADRCDVFLKLCKKMGMTIFRSSIKEIDQCAKGITVKLHRMEVKNLIMKTTREKFVWSNELFKLGKGRRPWKVRVCEHMTHFYSKMWFTALDLKERHQLHSFKITEDGLVVKRTPNSNDRVVLSEKQLFDYIRSNQP